jgi:hypothetical protein
MVLKASKASGQVLVQEARGQQMVVPRRMSDDVIHFPAHPVPHEHKSVCEYIDESVRQVGCREEVDVPVHRNPVQERSSWMNLQVDDPRSAVTEMGHMGSIAHP